MPALPRVVSQTAPVDAAGEGCSADAASARTLARSSSAEVAISATGLGKLYRLYERPQDRLKDEVFGRFGKSRGRDFWALHDVSFEVRRGEMFGVIGRNGSGKSTLLQILAGVLRPTSGQVSIPGRVGALLELGSGFNPEYTGRENIFVNGAILGLRRSEIDARLDDILTFADIGEFIDQPVKTYSSGMFVRLAFAVTTSIDAEVLLIDEALAVGDVFFRQKCYRRLDELRQRGVSIVFVSHAMVDVEQFCQRAILLHHGEVLFHGTATQSVKRYYLLEQGTQPARVARDRLPGAASSVVQSRLNDPPQAPSRPQSGLESVSRAPWSPTARDVPGKTFEWPSAGFFDLAHLDAASNGWARCTAVALCDADGEPCRVFQQGEPASFYYEFELFQPIEVPIGGVEISNDKGWIVHGKTSLEHGLAVPTRVCRGASVRFRQDVVLELAAGEYTFNVGFSCMAAVDFARRGIFRHEDLRAKLTRLCTLTHVGGFAVVLRRAGSPVQLLHHGVANLPGSLSMSVMPVDVDGR